MITGILLTVLIIIAATAASSISHIRKEQLKANEQLFRITSLALSAKAMVDSLAVKRLHYGWEGHSGLIGPAAIEPVAYDSEGKLMAAQVGNSMVHRSAGESEDAFHARLARVREGEDLKNGS